MFTNAPFAPGQTVIADGRTATIAYIAPNGAIYVATIAGLVPARAVTETSFGAPRQLQTGSPLHSRAHAGRIAYHRPRVIPLRRLAA